MHLVIGVDPGVFSRVHGACDADFMKVAHSAAINSSVVVGKGREKEQNDNLGENDCVEIDRSLHPLTQCI
jgi:hypothetical protein